MLECFECKSKDAQKFYMRIVPHGPGCEIGYVRNLCARHREELAARLASDQSSTFVIMPIAEYEQEREAEKIFREVMHECEREVCERGERELLRMLGL